MTPNRLFHHLLVLLAVWTLFPASAFGQVGSRLSTRFLARGEQALLEVSVIGSAPDSFPVVPAIEKVEVRNASLGPQTRLATGRKLEYFFEYLVSSYAVGNHTIPSIEMNVGGLKFRTQPIEFTVFDPDTLQWSEAVAGNIRFPYATAFRVLNDKPYEGETIPVEIKLFVPEELLVDDWGIPDFQRDGLTAWRFQPSALRGRINLLGLPFVSVAYPSTLTPTRTGSVAIGPATLRLVSIQTVMDGFLRRVAVPSQLDIPKIELESQPLPPGAPEGFENAIGDFSLAVSTTTTDVQEGEPILLDMIVSGSGNLDTLRPPKPVQSDGWKLFSVTPSSRGDERRELSGTAMFQQFVRPLELKSEIPSFRLVYFNPREKAYKSILSEPIALNMTPAAPRPADIVTPPPTAAVPVERMTDILGLMQPASLTIPSGFFLPPWFGHAVGGLIALMLVFKATWMRLRPRLRKNPEREARVAALREIEAARSKDDAGFLMAAGRYIERFLGSDPRQEIKDVLAERDSFCFRPDKQPGAGIDSKRRSAILRLLRSTIPLLMILLLLPASQVRADDSPEAAPAPAADLAQRAREAYDAARFSEAIALWLQAGPYQNLAADTLYNIGNACYRAGSSGHAALYYRRALHRDPGHVEARQNLRFIERKHGAITIHRPEYQYALAKLPLSAWRGIVWTGAWMCFLAMLVFPATRNGSPFRVVAIVALVAGPLVAACGGLGWRYFPDDAEFAPLSRQAVIIADDAVLHADASRTSPEVIDAPPGSLCEIIRHSGRWAYVSFATRTRGWIPVEAIEPVIPASPPVPPTIRKPKVDGKSA